MHHRWLPLLLASACTPDAGDPDRDGDGFRAAKDCDDDDPDVNPDATELPYDDVDQDCDPADDHPLGFERVPGIQAASQTAGPRFAAAPGLVDLVLVHRNGGDDVHPAWSANRFEAATTDPTTDRFELLDVAEGEAFAMDRRLDPEIAPDLTPWVAVTVTTAAGTPFAGVLALPEDGYWNWLTVNATIGTVEDVAMSHDGERVVLAVCGSAGIATLSGTVAELEAGSTHTAGTRARASVCEVRGDELRARLERTVTAYAIVGDEIRAGESWDDVTDFAWEAEGLLLVQGGALRLVTEAGTIHVPTRSTPARARFDVAPDGWTAIVYADREGATSLLFGPDAESLEEVFLDEELAAADLDVEASETALFVGARSGDDVWIGTALRAAERRAPRRRAARTLLSSPE